MHVACRHHDVVSKNSNPVLHAACPPLHPPQVGIFVEVRQLSATVTQRQLEAAVTALCADRRIDGVLVRLGVGRACVGCWWGGVEVAAAGAWTGCS